MDNIKVNISGDDFVNPAKGGMTVMSEAEVLAAVETAHDFGRRVNCHARAGGAVLRALHCGVDVIYHCEHMDATRHGHDAGGARQTCSSARRSA